jgi:DNA-directed RNA polymerase subunit alpha
MSLLTFQKPDKIVLQRLQILKDSLGGLWNPDSVLPSATRFRVLLSSLEGYAITSIRISGVEHNFLRSKE